MKDVNIAVLKLQRGKKKHFETIVDSYESKLYGFIYSMVKDTYITVDLVQETFIRVYNHIKSYDNKRNFSTWLLTIARNVTYDYLRKNARLQVVADIDEVDDNTPESAFIKEEFNRSIDELVEQLPEHLRVLIHMKYFDDMTYEEMAKKLETTPNRVKWQLYDARKKLEKKIKQVEVILCRAE